jgi:uncharacterized protein (DUF1330 family)
VSAYLISRLSIRDAEAMARYVAGAPATVAEFGGRYLVRANAATALEGSWDDDRIVVLEFPTREAALAWYHSPAYRELRDLRWSAADAVILLADGAEPGSVLASHRVHMLTRGIQVVTMRKVGRSESEPTGRGRERPNRITATM